MKKNLLALFIGLASIGAPCMAASAQHLERSASFKDSKQFRTTLKKIADLDKPVSADNYIPDLNNVNTNALKDFKARFKSAVNARWYADQHGCLSYFILNGNIDRVCYDKKGNWQYSLIFYNEFSVPGDIRTIVKSVYYDMKITQVEELQVPDHTFYIFHLEDRSKIKIVKVNTDGEMETIDELVKQ